MPATGTRTTIRLSHLPKDYDLVVYGRQGTTPLVQPGSAAPLETPVLADSGARSRTSAKRSPRRRSTTSGSIRSSGARRLGVPNHRGRGRRSRLRRRPRRIHRPGDGLQRRDERPALHACGERGAPPPPTCQPRFYSFGAATALPRVDPADTDTLFLANGPQLGAPAGWASSTGSRLSTSTNSAGPATRAPSSASRTIRPCERRTRPGTWSPAARHARTAWWRSPTWCGRSATRARQRNLVLLGNDKALPFARLDDLTTIANEADYASTFARGDDLYGPMFEHRVLSDDLRDDRPDPVPSSRFVPQLAVGRLVETQAQITGALDRFVAFGGDLDPASARTTGYDLKDGAADVAAAFAGIIGAQQPATNPPLIGDLDQHHTPGRAEHNDGLFGMNGHADHHRLQPAAGSGLFSAANLPASLQRAVVFSMGCHSALSVSDAAVPGNRLAAAHGRCDKRGRIPETSASATATV